MIQTLRATIAEIDTRCWAFRRVDPMDEVISNVEAPRRFNTDLIAAFAVGALVLAITGIYAVAFGVAARADAVRMAVGARRGNIARLVLISSAKLALIGCGIGVVGSVAVSSPGEFVPV